METNINIATEQLRQQLIKDINSAGLPMCILYLVVNELQQKTERAYYAELNAPMIKEINQENNETEGESE